MRLQHIAQRHTEHMILYLNPIFADANGHLSQAYLVRHSIIWPEDTDVAANDRILCSFTARQTKGPARTRSLGSQLEVLQDVMRGFDKMPSLFSLQRKHTLH